MSIIGCNAASDLVQKGFTYQPLDAGSYYLPTPTAPVPNAVPLLTSTYTDAGLGTIVLVLNVDTIFALGAGWSSARQVGWAFNSKTYSNVVPVYQAHLNGGKPWAQDYFYTESLGQWLDRWDHGWNADGKRDQPPVAFWAPLTSDATPCFPGEPPPSF
jgi:hypothetical protein